MAWNSRYIKSKYKHVCGSDIEGKIYWMVAMTGVSKTHFATERQAAIAADKYLISKGRSPVNILKAI
jgi:hypothetical protein